MADLLSYSLCSLSDVKESLGISGTSQDNLIKRMINRATLNIETYCNLARDHHFKETTYTDEVYRGSGSDQLNLLMRPISDITSFQVHDAYNPSASYSSVDSDLYYEDLSTGTINLLYDQNTSYGSYRVSYTAGYATIPADLAEACVALASFYVENGSSGTNVKQKTEGARSIEYFQSQGSDSVIEELGLDDTLHRYMNYVVG